MRPPLPVTRYLSQHRPPSLPNGDVHLRLLPRHTSNFSPASYFLSIVSGAGYAVVDITATMQTLPYPHPPAAVYFNQAQYTVNPYPADRLRVLSDDAYIEQLQWRVVDLERELGQSNCEVLESASSLRIQRQNAALMLQVDDLRQQLAEAQHSHPPSHQSVEEDRHHLLQLEAQVEQYKATAVTARHSIQELNHRVEHQAEEIRRLQRHSPDPSHPHDHHQPSHPTTHHQSTHHSHPLANSSSSSHAHHGCAYPSHFTSPSSFPPPIRVSQRRPSLH